MSIIALLGHHLFQSVSLGCMVSYSFHEVVPHLWELSEIVTHLECGVVFILQLYDTLCSVNEHYHALEA